MHLSNVSGMATLLQQKNCMKTLSNGNVVGGGGGGSTTTTTTTSSSGTTNGANSASITGTTMQQTRMLLPNEVVALPINSISSAVGNSNNSTQNSFVISGFQTQPQSQIIELNNLSQPNQQTFNHHVTTAAATVTQTRYFSQFSNNQESNNTIFSSLVNRTHTNNSHIFTPATISSLATQHSNVGLIKEDQLPPNTTISTLMPSQYISSTLQHTLKVENSSIDDDINVPSICDQTNNDQQAITTGESAAAAPKGVAEEEQEPEPEIDIVINNVVCSFSVRCHLNLREIALNGFNVEFRRENGMVTMKLRRPYTTASIWSSGRITCTGATSEDQAKIAARRYARCLQKLGFRVRFNNFRVVNVLGTCSMPWAIKIVNFSERYKKEASYEPELHPGVTYKLKYPKATLKIFSTGSITVTAGSVAHVQAAIEHIFPLVYEFRKKRTPEELELLRVKQQAAALAHANEDEAIHSSKEKKKRPLGIAENDPNEDIMYISDCEADEIIEGHIDGDDDL